MKKVFASYTLMWAICLAIFNVICFVTPSEAWGYEKFGGAFWVGYIFITLSFVGQIICAFAAFKAENLQKLFYKIPIVRISYIGLVITMIVGTACMAIPDLPNWVGLIVCVLVLAFTANAVRKANAAAIAVAAVDDKVRTSTDFIKNLTSEAESLIAPAKTAEAKNACRKVYEALRYSDPMSNDALSDIENQIALKFNEFSNAVTTDAGNIDTLADGLVILIGDRNKKCKLVK